MKKLDEIPKKNIYEVPEGYFEALPGRIQARIAGTDASPRPAFFFRYRLQYVLPAVLLLVLGTYWYTSPEEPADVNSLLASVQTEELVAYLGDSDMTTEDLIETVEFDHTDLEEIENEIYQLPLNEDTLDEILETDAENI